jgi:MFS family permease
VAAVRERLARPARALRAVWANPNLRRVQTALAAIVVGGFAYGTALSVFAFEAGGATAVGVVLLIVMLPPGIAAPFGGVLADRFPRERVLFAATSFRVLALAGTAAAMLGGAPDALVYTLAAVGSVPARVIFPTQAALLPSLARSADELTAANVVADTIESVAVFAGPALAGLLVAVVSPGWVVCATTVLAALAALELSRVRSPRPTEPVREAVLPRLLGGFRAIVHDRRVRVLIGLYTAVSLVVGALGALLVVASFDLLGLGKAGVGYLNAAVGAGGVLGSLAALTLVGQRKLALYFGVGVFACGAPLAVIGAVPSAAVALVLLGVVGVGNTLVDVSTLTLLQRAVDNAVLGRVFGVLEGLAVATIGIGAILAPALVHGLGIRGALVATGAFLPVLAALVWKRLLAIDAAAPVPARQLELLRGVPFFAPLPGPVLEGLAGHLVPTSFPSGATLFREGDDADHLFLVDRGEAAVGDVTLGPGSFFGETALLPDGNRTATVVARSPLELYALPRNEFVAAVAGHAAPAQAVQAAIARRVASLRASVASI